MLTVWKVGNQAMMNTITPWKKQNWTCHMKQFFILLQNVCDDLVPNNNDKKKPMWMIIFLFVIMLFNHMIPLKHSFHKEYTICQAIRVNRDQRVAIYSVYTKSFSLNVLLLAIQYDCEK